jgi:hypothetical protein
MRNTAGVTSGKPIAVSSQFILGVSAGYSFAAFYDIHRSKGEVLFFCSVPDLHENKINVLNYKYRESGPPSRVDSGSH